MSTFKLERRPSEQVHRCEHGTWRAECRRELGRPSWTAEVHYIIKVTKVTAVKTVAQVPIAGRLPFARHCPLCGVELPEQEEKETP